MNDLTSRSPDEDVEAWIATACAALTPTLTVNRATHSRLYGYAVDRRLGLVTGPVLLDRDDRLWLHHGERRVELVGPPDDVESARTSLPLFISLVTGIPVPKYARRFLEDPRPFVELRPRFLPFGPLLRAAFRGAR